MLPRRTRRSRTRSRRSWTTSAGARMCLRLMTAWSSRCQGTSPPRSPSGSSLSRWPRGTRSA
eukprot:2604938-Alexandrium_andersonii.AAC.1